MLEAQGSPLVRKGEVTADYKAMDLQEAANIVVHYADEVRVSEVEESVEPTEEDEPSEPAEAVEVNESEGSGEVAEVVEADVPADSQVGAVEHDTVVLDGPERMAV